MRLLRRPDPSDWAQTRKQVKARSLFRTTLIQTVAFSILWVLLQVVFNLLFSRRPLLSWWDSIFCFFWGLFLWNQMSFTWHDNEWHFRNTIQRDTRSIE
jgi:hypothetical protein